MSNGSCFLLFIRFVVGFCIIAVSVLGVTAGWACRVAMIDRLWAAFVWMYCALLCSLIFWCWATYRTLKSENLFFKLILVQDWSNWPVRLTDECFPTNQFPLATTVLGSCELYQLLGIAASYDVILQSVWREVRSVLQSEFSTGCDLVLPLSVSSTFAFS
jgi:hypothetical protein